MDAMMENQAPRPSRAETDRALAAVGWNMSGAEIERMSFRRIEEECAADLAALPPDHRLVARRLIHTTADTGLARWLDFSPGAAAAGVAALRSAAGIVCDSNMIRAGLSLPKLRRCSPLWDAERIRCHIADPDVAEEAKRTGRTRAISAMEKALALGETEGAVVLVGNAPLALAGLCRAVLEGRTRPALVVGMPVGFVNVLESKALLALCPVPRIVLRGRRGGSPLAVACLHALIEACLAEEVRP